MPITERTLKKWRQEALIRKEFLKTFAVDPGEYRERLEEQDRILRMTQELLDQHLIRKETK